MDVDGKLVAIVGPNESGKSSFLHALVHLNDTAPFVTSGGSQETTRGSLILDGQEIVKATYLLDDADRAALDGVLGGNKVRWFTVAKTSVGGMFFCGITPTPRRSLKPRQAVAKVLSDVLLKAEFEDLELLSEDEKAHLTADSVSVDPRANVWG